jgi:hypothetical protein
VGANLALARFFNNKNGCRIQPVLIWHMIDWFSTACCLYGARSKNKHALYSLLLLIAHCPLIALIALIADR